MIRSADYYDKYIKYKTKYLNLKMNQFDIQHNWNKTIDTEIHQIGGLNSKDLNEILTMTPNIKIIAMGQATHGQNMINKYCADMFKLLVKYHNVTVFVVEDQYSCCRLIDNYIKGDDSFSLNNLIKKLMWPWRSIHLVRLIKWMRKYNDKHNNILDFHGVDINRICEDYMIEDDITSFIKGAVIKNRELSNFDYEKNPKYEKCEIDNFRDKSMFDIFMKIYNNNKKYFILMHNGHVAKEPEYKDIIRFGNHMANYFKNNYFVIGNSFNGNSFLAINRQKEGFDVSDYKGEIDISKLKYYNGVTNDYDDEINYKNVTDDDLKYKLQNGITWSPKYNKLLNKNNIPIKNNNTNYREMFTIEAGARMDPDDIYRALTLYKINNKFDVVLQLKGDSYLKF